MHSLKWVLVGGLCVLSAADSIKEPSVSTISGFYFSPELMWNWKAALWPVVDCVRYRFSASCHVSQSSLCDSDCVMFNRRRLRSTYGLFSPQPRHHIWAHELTFILTMHLQYSFLCERDELKSHMLDNPSLNESSKWNRKVLSTEMKLIKMFFLGQNGEVWFSASYQVM